MKEQAAVLCLSSRFASLSHKVECFDASNVGVWPGFKRLGAKRATKRNHKIAMFDARTPPASSDNFSQTARSAISQFMSLASKFVTILLTPAMLESRKLFWDCGPKPLPRYAR